MAFRDQTDKHDVKSNNDQSTEASEKLLASASGASARDSRSAITTPDTASKHLPSGLELLGNAGDYALSAFNKTMFAPAAAVDAIAGTHMIKAIGDLQKGMVNEAINHPGEMLKDVAIGAAIAAATVATGGGALVGLGLGAAAFGAGELIKNKGDVGGVVNDMKNLGNSVVGWGHDFATVAGTEPHTRQELDAAERGLQQAGAFGAHTLAGSAGGMAGGFAATAAGLERSIPNAIRSATSRELSSLGDAPPAARLAAASDTSGAPKSELSAASITVAESIAQNKALFQTAAESGDGIVPSVKQDYNVHFKKVTEPTEVRTLEGLKTGTTETAQPGQWIATRLNADGTPNIENGIVNSWPLKESHILKNYKLTQEELNGASHVKGGTKTDAPPIHMIKLTEPTTMRAEWGTMSGEAGDFLANYDFKPGLPGEDYAIVTGTSYKQTYKPHGS